MKHEPECYCSTTSNPEHLCICDRLRSAEKRGNKAVLDALDQYKMFADSYNVGYSAGIKAARDAIEALPKVTK